ncbi:MAG: hypothetical protein QME51_00785 [Planctomycetota bacterium]|nr:hypothetical protein [Planctomycetota bacterium]
MPFKSEKQRRYLWLKEPGLARRWTEKYGSKPQGSKSAENIKKRLGKRKRNKR